jgi:hypothetical protein
MSNCARTPRCHYDIVGAIYLIDAGLGIALAVSRTSFQLEFMVEDYILLCKDCTRMSRLYIFPCGTMSKEYANQNCLFNHSKTQANLGTYYPDVSFLGSNTICLCNLRSSLSHAIPHFTSHPLLWAASS